MCQLSVHVDDPILRDLFESCKTGDLAKVRKLINPQTVNARDTAGRKSTPLHFAAGEYNYRFPLCGTANGIMICDVQSLAPVLFSDSGVQCVMSIYTVDSLPQLMQFLI